MQGTLFAQLVAKHQNLQEQIDNIVTNSSGDANTTEEVAQARVCVDGTNYPTLKERLDSENENLKEIASFHISNYSLTLDSSMFVQGAILTSTPYPEVDTDNTSYRSVYIPVLSGTSVTIISESKTVLWKYDEFKGVIAHEADFIAGTRILETTDTKYLRVVVYNENGVTEEDMSNIKLFMFDKNALTLNVRDMGAYGDGKKNDTIVLQKAISMANELRSSVYIPKSSQEKISHLQEYL